MMRSQPDDDLLRPSLSGQDTSGTVLYSATAGFIASFFGGPVAGSVIALLNARRLGRLGKDWSLGLVAIVLHAAVVWWDVRVEDSWLKGLLGNNAGGVAMRMAGLAYFGGVYWLYRRSYRSMDLLGVKAAPGWVPAIAGFVVGIVFLVGCTVYFTP